VKQLPIFYWKKWQIVKEYGYGMVYNTTIGFEILSTCIQLLLVHDQACGIGCGCCVSVTQADILQLSTAP